MSGVDRCVAQVPIFGRLGDGAQDQVASFARPRELDRGETLYRQGDAVAQLFIIHRGTAKMTRLRADGQERLVRSLEPGQVVGEHAFLNGTAPDHTITATSPLRACVFDHRDMVGLTARHPGIAFAMLQELSRRLSDAEHRLTAMTTSDVGARVADYLLTLPAGGGSEELVVELPMSKRDVASYLGTTPESFSRALAKLERDGLVTIDRARIGLRDLDALEARAGSAGLV